MKSKKRTPHIKKYAKGVVAGKIVKKLTKLLKKK